MPWCDVIASDVLLLKGFGANAAKEPSNAVFATRVAGTWVIHVGCQRRDEDQGFGRYAAGL